MSLSITRQITQEDINLLHTKTTAARSSQEAVMTQPMFVNECKFKEG